MARDAKSWNRLGTEERRSQILEAARRLFAERPYGEVSTTEVADAAGVTRGLVHHYFGTKRELYLEAVREIVSVPAVTLFGSLVSASSPRPLVSWEQGVDAWMHLVETNREVWLLAVSAGETGQDRAMQQILYQARELAAAQVMSVLGLGDADGPEAKSLVMAFGRFAEEVTVEWLERRNLTREQARVLLTGSLPLLSGKLLPRLSALRGEAGREDR